MAGAAPGEPSPETRTSDGAAASAETSRGTARITTAEFAPGTLLASRYRIVSRLGRGGMGEVFRADDLRLGVAVALKFLPASRAADPIWLSRLLAETRTARDITHPNVCRIHDIAEHRAADGETLHFIVMEYVDGDDLAALLKRVGHFNQARGLEIARQLCLGLSAAHERGVLHRDLKPANIMIDGRGTARIMDFGIAAVSDRIDGQAAADGTPAYMAPEQRAGKEFTARSDLYALGLILYELFTGQRPAAAAPPPGDTSGTGSSSRLTTPTSVVRDLDPAIERTIVRCLAEEPAERPRSAVATLASLPGGDPLLAALAAGETPSPKLIAASGATGTISKRTGVALLLLILATTIFQCFYDEKYENHRVFPAQRSPDVLLDRAAEHAAALRFPVDARQFWPTHRSENLGDDNDYRLVFWPETFAKMFETYRHRFNYLECRYSPENIARIGPYDINLANLRIGDSGFPSDGWLRYYWPPPREGDVLVQVGNDGRLIGFAAHPAPATTRPAFPATRPALPDRPPASTFAAVLGLAKLDPARFVPAPPLPERPLAYFDRRFAFVAADEMGWPFRIEIATLEGRTTYFAALPIFDLPADVQREDAERLHLTVRQNPPVPSYRGGKFNAAFEAVRQWAPYLSTLLLGALLVAAGASAARSLRGGKLDHRSAVKIGLLVGAAKYAQWFFAALTYLPRSIQAFYLCVDALPRPLLYVAGTYVLYLAVDPALRRWWPQSLTSWARVLEGRFGDPLVCRDYLYGLSAACVFALLEAVILVVDAWWDNAFNLCTHANGTRVHGVVPTVSFIAETFAVAVALPTAFLFALALIRSRVANRPLAYGLFAVGATVVTMNSLTLGNPALQVGTLLFGASLLTFVGVRMGLFAAAAYFFGRTIFFNGLLTATTDSPEFNITLVLTAVILVPAAFAFRHATRRPETAQ